ncbi:hypothetical protein H0O02_01980 [Candidatus Micrarchaeota archaeon]|nr:hypothetical protein [Candidatus Micrarchaeota archaeon]
MKKLVVMLVLAAFMSAGCLEQMEGIGEKYCAGDSDCACGVHKTTEQCFYGNKQYVDMTKQCPDFCTGIAGNLDVKCVDFVCTQVRVR